MPRPRTHDHDAILDRWASGAAAKDIAGDLHMRSVNSVLNIVAAARAFADPRAVRREAPHKPDVVSSPPIVPGRAEARSRPLHVRLGIKAETIFVPTLVRCSGDHWHRTPVTVASLHGGPVIYEQSTYRDRFLPKAITDAVKRACEQA
jgi:hypothetical protein